MFAAPARERRNITNIDTSAVVINHMKDVHAQLDEIEFSVMDATRLEFLPDDCFDLILDKALLVTLTLTNALTHDCFDLIFDKALLVTPTLTLI